MPQFANLEQQIAALPEDAQREVADFIAALEAQHVEPSSQQTETLRDDPFVGCWKDRDDLADSTAWVRRTRQEEWGPADS